MKITIINCHDKNFEPFVIRAIRFFGNILFENKNLLRRINIELTFHDNMEDMGEAMIDEFTQNGKPKKFTIRVNYSVGAYRIFETIAHEMVHIKQYALGELDAQMTVWKGHNVNLDELDYEFRPWEIEAVGLEMVLLRKFITDEELWKVFKGITNPNNYKLENKTILWKKQYEKFLVV